MWVVDLVAGSLLAALEGGVDQRCQRNPAQDVAGKVGKDQHLEHAGSRGENPGSRADASHDGSLAKGKRRRRVHRLRLGYVRLQTNHGLIHWIQHPMRCHPDRSAAEWRDSCLQLMTKSPRTGRFIDLPSVPAGARATQFPAPALLLTPTRWRSSRRASVACIY